MENGVVSKVKEEKPANSEQSNGKISVKNGKLWIHTSLGM